MLLTCAQCAANQTQENQKKMIRPTRDRLLVRREEAESTSGGIIIPQTAKERPNVGLVIATGDGRTTDAGVKLPMSIAANQKVVFKGYGGTEVNHAGEDYLLISEDDVLAVIE